MSPARRRTVQEVVPNVMHYAGMVDYWHGLATSQPATDAEREAFVANRALCLESLERFVAELREVIA